MKEKERKEDSDEKEEQEEWKEVKMRLLLMIMQAKNPFSCKMNEVRIFLSREGRRRRKREKKEREEWKKDEMTRDDSLEEKMSLFFGRERRVQIQVEERSELE